MANSAGIFILIGAGGVLHEAIQKHDEEKYKK
jgi:hypothetical protein